MKQKEKVLFLADLINKYEMYPDRVIISKLGYGYVITDFDKSADIEDARILNKLTKHFKEIIVIDIDGSGVIEFSEFDTDEYSFKSKWLTPEQACEYLQISMSYLNQLIKEGRIPAYSPDKKVRRFKIEDLDRFLEGKPRRGRKPSKISIY